MVNDKIFKNKNAKKIENEIKESFACHYCNKTFSKKESLGGHIGKAHKNVSKAAYENKLKKRDSRSSHREIL